MPFLPTFNDFKNVSISINPLNLFSDSTKAQSSEIGEANDGIGKAGPGPSSLANMGGRPGRPSLKSETSSSESFDVSHVRGRSAGQGVMIQEDQRPKREKKKKVQMDSYIIVKPPPTSSKNALNLQIQLVMGKGGRGRSDSSATDRTAPRTSSVFIDPTAPRTNAPSTPPLTAGSRITLGPIIQSDQEVEGSSRKGGDSPDRESSDEGLAAPTTASTLHTNGSGLKRITSRKSSSSSIPLSMNSNSGQKRIQPMFNLNVHNVMSASVVTDAGTDAKVAKFGKRYIDIVDVGVLEPTEIWQVPANSAGLFPPSSALEEIKSRPMSLHSLTFPISPTTTRLADDGSRTRNSIDNMLRPEILQEGGASAKRFFGKIGGAFKKKNAGEKDGGSQNSTLRGSSPVPNNGAFPASSATMGRGGSKDAAAVAGLAVGPPTFGCSPNVIARRMSASPLPSCAADGLAPPDSIVASSSRQQGSNRPVGYAWTVKRWAKRNTDGWAAHLVEAVTLGVTMQGEVGGEGEDEVTFEWAKMRSSSTNITPRSRRSSIASRGHSRPPSTTAAMESPQASRTSVSQFNNSSVSQPNTPGLSPRPGPVRRSSATSSLIPHKTDLVIPDDSSAVYHTAEEDDSDPEDSETPWSCTLIVKRTGQTQLIGTLTPAPHHPKVVGQLKLPSKLDTLCLANLSGSAEHLQKVMKEVCLSDEAVKDVVCVTALWLVAREGWNGLGKVKRGR